MLPRALALAVAMTVIPLPVAAADGRPAKAGPIRASVAKFAATDAAAPRASRAKTTRRSAQDAPGQDRSFFKSRPGMLALAVMIVGTGYALYSAREDRITSPAKK